MVLSSDAIYSTILKAISKTFTLIIVGHKEPEAAGSLLLMHA